MDSQKGFVLILVGILVGLFWLMLQPFLAYILGGVILAFILRPFQEKLSPFLGSRVTASLLITGSLIIALVPMTLATIQVVNDAGELSADIQETDLVNTTMIEQRIMEYTGRHFDIENAVDAAVTEFTTVTFGSVSQLLNLATNISIGITIMLFLIYYLLKDGEEFVEWIQRVTPLPMDIQENLYDRIDKTTWAVIKGHVLVAVTQGLLAGLGLLLTGVPNWVFWTFVMVLLGFVPIIGTIFVWGPAGIYLIMVNRFEAGILLLIYGTIVMLATDNLMRPFVVDKSAELHPAAIIIGLIGGVYLFGAPGLFIGPILIGILKSVLLVFENHYEDL